MKADRAAPVHSESPATGSAYVDVPPVITSVKNDMDTDDELLRELIGTAFSGSPDACAEVSAQLLQRLDKSLNHIIGDEGFNSLLFRTAHRVSHQYSWFRFDPRTLPADPQFSALRLCFEGQDPGQARAASMHFFSTFIDVLASLIGAHLTTLILNSALSGASAATSSKEQNDE